MFIFTGLILSLTISSAIPAKHLSYVLRLEPEQTWISSNSGCCSGCTTALQEPLTNIGSRSKPPDRPKVNAAAKFVFLTPCCWREIQCVPTKRRFGIFQFGISLFSQLCFLAPHSLGRRWRLLHSPQSAQMHFGPHCNAFQCSELHCSALQPVL